MSATTLKQLCNSFNKIRITHAVIRTSATYRPPKYRPPHWFVPKERVLTDDKLTSENRQFLEEVLQDKLATQEKLSSPLTQVESLPEVEWNKFTRRVGLIGRKIGNYPIWLKDGKKVQTTLIQESVQYKYAYLVFNFPR